MLVGPNDGGVDEQFFEVGLALERLGDAMPYPVHSQRAKQTYIQDVNTNPDTVNRP